MKMIFNATETTIEHFKERYNSKELVEFFNKFMSFLSSEYQNITSLDDYREYMTNFIIHSGYADLIIYLKSSYHTSGVYNMKFSRNSPIGVLIEDFVDEFVDLMSKMFGESYFYSGADYFGNSVGLPILGEVQNRRFSPVFTRTSPNKFNADDLDSI